MPDTLAYLDEHRPYHTLTQLRDLIRRGHGSGCTPDASLFRGDGLTATSGNGIQEPGLWLRAAGTSDAPNGLSFGVGSAATRSIGLSRKVTSPVPFWVKRLRQKTRRPVYPSTDKPGTQHGTKHSQRQSEGPNFQACLSFTRRAPNLALRHGASGCSRAKSRPSSFRSPKTTPKGIRR